MSESVVSRRARKIRAVLAGGLVLGVGAAITLAAWNDSEFAVGSFESGEFNLEGSIDGSEFGEHAATDSAAELGFDISTSNLAPGTVVSAPFAVRLDETTTYDATALVSATPTGDVTGLTYSLATTEGFGCENSPLDTLVDAGTAVGAIDADGATFELLQGDGADGQAVNLCFTVTATEDMNEGQSGTATWEFAAESKG